MYASQRKMKRTKREQAMVVENMNRDAINHLLQQSFGLGQAVINIQKTLLALTNVLKKQRIVDDFVLHQEMAQNNKLDIIKIMDQNRCGLRSWNQS